MAIISSIIMSKARKSIGNVTLATVKGRIIAKEKASIVSNPNTDKQKLQRGAMSKIVFLFQIFAALIRLGTTRMSQYGSAYNRFVTNNIAWVKELWISTIDDLSIAIAGIVLTEGNLSKLDNEHSLENNLLSVNALLPNDVKAVAKIGDKIYFVYFDSLVQVPVINIVTLDAEMIESGIVANDIDLPAANLRDNEVFTTFFLSADGKQSSTSIFEAV